MLHRPWGRKVCKTKCSDSISSLHLERHSEVLHAEVKDGQGPTLHRGGRSVHHHVLNPVGQGDQSVCNARPRAPTRVDTTCTWPFMRYPHSLLGQVCHLVQPEVARPAIVRHT